MQKKSLFVKALIVLLTMTLFIGATQVVAMAAPTDNTTVVIPLSAAEGTGATVGIVRNGSWVVSPIAATFDGSAYKAEFSLVAGTTYEVRVAKGGMNYVGSVIGGETLTVPVRTLTVNTGIAGCMVGMVQNGSWVYAPVIEATTQKIFNVFGNTTEYEVRINYGGMSYNSKTMGNNLRAGDVFNAPVKTLTVNTVIPGCTVGVVQNGSWVYSPVTLGAAVTQKIFAVLDNGTEYEVRVNYGGMNFNSKTMGDQRVKAGDTFTVPTSMITIPAGLTGVGLVQNGSWVFQSIQSPSTITVFKNGLPAELRYNGGPFRFTMDGSFTGKVTLKVLFTGMSGVAVNVYNASNVNLGWRGANNETSYSDVIAGTYRAELSKYGAAFTKKFTISAADIFASYPGNVYTLDTKPTAVTIKYQGIGGVNLSVKSAVNPSADVAYSQSPNVSTVYLFRNWNYNLAISKAGVVYSQSISVGDVDSMTIDTQPTTVTIDYTGIGGVNLGVRASSTSTSGDFAYDQGPNVSTVTLFRNKTYFLRINKAGVVYTADLTVGDVDSMTYSVPRRTFRVINIMGVNGAGMAVRYRVPGGTSDFQYMQAPQDGSVSAVVFDNMDYELIVSQYAISGNLYDHVYHVSGTGSADYVVDLSALQAGVTVDYTGLYYAPNVYLYDSANKQIGYSQSADKSVFGLKRGSYTVTLLKNGLTKSYPFTVSVMEAYSGLKTVTIPLVNLTVVQPNGVNYYCNINVIPVNGSGNIAYSQSGAETVTGMKLFPGEPYRIYFNGGMNFTDTFTVGSTDYTYTVPTAKVTFDTTGITYGYGMNLFVTNTSNGATAQYLQVLKDHQYLSGLIIGNTYRVVLYQGSTIVFDQTFTITGDRTIPLGRPSVINVFEAQGLVGLTNEGTVSDAVYNLTSKIGAGDIHIKPAFAFNMAIDPSKVRILVTDGYNGSTYQDYTGSSWVSIGVNTYTHNNGPQIFEPSGDVKSGLNDKLKYQIYYDGQLIYTYTVKVYVP